MKQLIALLSLVTLSFSAMAADKVLATEDGEMQILTRVIGVQRTYSETSGYDAKVVELLAGDGVNATRMALILNDGMGNSKVYELGEMMYSVTRITFLAKDVIVINYLQDSFEGPDMDKQIRIKKSMKVTVQKDAQGSLTSQILTEDISK